MMLDIIKNIFTKKEKQDTSKPVYQLRDSDIYIDSYPKSGNTWVRFLLSNYISNDFIDYHSSNLLIPDIEYNPEKIDKISTFPRFIKTHYPCTSDFKNVIYILRDGRDVAVSYYYFNLLFNEIDENMSFKEYFNDFFLKGKSPYGDWGEHITSWTNGKGTRILFIKYEDLRNDTAKAFTEIVKFSNLSFDTEKIKRAVANSTFERMKQLEKDSPDYFYDEFKMKRKSYGFIREGKTGGWKNYFDEESLNAFNKKYSAIMQQFSYTV